MEAFTHSGTRCSKAVGGKKREKNGLVLDKIARPFNSFSASPTVPTLLPDDSLIFQTYSCINNAVDVENIVTAGVRSAYFGGKLILMKAFTQFVLLEQLIAEREKTEIEKAGSEKAGSGEAGREEAEVRQKIKSKEERRQKQCRKKAGSKKAESKEQGSKD